MTIKINGVDIATPSEFTVTILDIDNGESTSRSADGTLNRDRIAVKRQIEMSWNLLRPEEISLILKLMSDVFFEVEYPDPQEGKYITKTFYVGNRPAPVAIEKNGQLLWKELRVTLTER